MLKNKRETLLLILIVAVLMLVLSSCFLLKEKLTLHSLPSNVKIEIDNKQVVMTPYAENMSFGKHKLDVLTTYKTVGDYGGNDNVKYTFESWADGSRENPRVINLDFSKVYTVHMDVQYKLLINGNVPKVSIHTSPTTLNDFYAKDSVVKLTAPKISEYLFKGWKVNGTFEPNNPLQLYMTNPIQATALYAPILPPNKPSISYPSNGADKVSTDVTLRWLDTDPNGLPLSYDLYFGTSKKPQLLIQNINSSHYSLYNLNYSTTYYWYVVANDGQGTASSDTWSFTTRKPPSPPPAPTNLHETSVTSSSISIAWDSSPKSSGYKIYRSVNDKDFFQIGQTSLTNYTDEGLNSSTTYYYKVAAFNLYGESKYSDTVSVTTESSQKKGVINGKVDLYTGQTAFVTYNATKANLSASWKIKKSRKVSYVPGEVIVGFKKNVEIHQALKISKIPFNYKIMSTLSVPDQSVNSALLKVSVDVEDAVRYFESLQNVEYAEPNYLSYALSIPDDPYYSDQWNLRDIHVPQAWQVVKGDNTVVVAVVDTGVSLTHPDLKEVLVPGYNFVSNNADPMDNYGHGTHVAGIIAAETNNSIGVAGVDWGGKFSTKIMPIKVLNSKGIGDDYQVAEGIVYATLHGAKVVNLSLGGSDFSVTEQKACQYAYENGVVLVAAAGNDNENSLDYPAAFSTVIPVSAVGPNNTRAYYSNYSSDVIYAPGGEMHYDGDPNGIISTYYATATTPHNTYAYLQGTSMAAPHVSAVAALMISKGITGPNNIWNILKKTSTKIGASSEYGYGLLNAYNAVTYNGGWEPLIVWAENANGNKIATATVANNGSFSLKLPLGTYKIYAWQDFNGDGMIDSGDFYGFYGYNGNSTCSPIPVSVTSTSNLNLTIFVSPKINDSDNPLGVSDFTKMRRYLKSIIKKHYDLIH